MTASSTNCLTAMRERAQERREKSLKMMRRGSLAYAGFYGTAYDQLQSVGTEGKRVGFVSFDDLVKTGEELEGKVISFFKGKREDATETFSEGKTRLWNLTPGAKVNRVEELEAELEAARKKFEKLSKAAAKPAKAKKNAAKPAAKAAKVAKTVAATAEIETMVKTETAPAAPTKAAKPAAKETPRHIPYLEDVKRYDPLANEDIVRKIVNHCGIALRSEDAKYVACSDEAERNRVRDSWMKKKLELTGTDAELDKKVQNTCSIMQRDNRKNRVTFYYLVAKAERKLDTL